MSARTPDRNMCWVVSLIVLSVLLGSLVRAALALPLGLAWLIALVGLAHLIVAQDAHRAYILIWRLIVGFAYVLFGVYVIAYPGIGPASLTIGLALLFLFEGVFDTLVFCRFRAIEGSSWILVKGIVSLTLGVMSYLHWPTIPKWAIGVLVGAGMIMNGATLVILWLPARDAKTEKLRSDPSAKEYWNIHG